MEKRDTDKGRDIISSKTESNNPKINYTKPNITLPHEEDQDEPLNYNFEVLKKKLKENDSFIDYFLSFKIANLGGLLRAHEDGGDQFIQHIIEKQDSFYKYKTGKNTVDVAQGKTGNTAQFQDLAMDLLDKVPPVDRDSLPISEVVEIVPRQLFNRDALNFLDPVINNVLPIYSYSTIYLPSVNKYVHLVGALLYENITDMVDPAKEDEVKEELLELDKNKTSENTNKRLWVPKILVLASRNPIFEEMK